ncbi:hypothetical protein [Paenibacillus sp. N3.4]|uniref:hypothetical protein n=1 Tax=Paenibacillus sp. N3.4 TaxID=2603222 RepID=UPI0011C9A1CC|nr:hypothetical protein [Paenibacillus sp. N3.4]TXK77013.1 hypothetical protein FU659_23760 [Paenibacillus sp. N3.4]
MINKHFTLLSLFVSLLIPTEGYAVASPREKLLEEALIMQLHSQIQSSLKEHFQENLIQYDCEHISEIRMIYLPSGTEYLEGGKAFEITVELRKKDTAGDKLVHLKLSNEKTAITYALVSIKNDAVPKGFQCSKISP